MVRYTSKILQHFLGRHVSKLKNFLFHLWISSYILAKRSLEGVGTFAQLQICFSWGKEHNFVSLNSASKHTLSLSYNFLLWFTWKNFCKVIIKSITRSLIIFKKSRKMTNDFFNNCILIHTFQWTWCPLERVDEYIVIEEIVCHLSRFLKND